ncbi:hypothetical protein Vretifemale_10923, partial [Volvox reticuliferus]
TTLQKSNFNIDPLALHNRLGGGGLVEDNAIELLLEPLDGVLLGHLVLDAHPRLALPAAGHTVPSPFQAHVEIHAVNTSRGVILQSQINVLLDTETEVAGVRKVLTDKLELLHGQAALHQIVGLLAADGHKARNLLITADSERADCKTSLPVHRNLRCQLFQ